jgi:hypothetical protein
MDSFSASETYSGYTYWREEPAHDAFEDEMRADLEEIARRQKAMKSNSKTKGTPATTPVASAAPKTTPVASAAPKTTQTTTVVKAAGEPLLTIAQATENTVKKP